MSAVLLAGRYRLVERIAHGGSAAVWRGYDERLSRPIAVKILSQPVLGWAQVEARSLALLADPHIAAVYDYGSHRGQPFLVTELVDGRSLAATLAERALPWPDVVRCCAQIASALAAAHARGLVHRDVTPANIMLSRTGAKLIDFGISARTGDREGNDDGDIRGTPPYAAPERLHGGRVAPATDVYALGVVLYRALSGRLPWSAATTAELVVAQRCDPPATLPPVDGLPSEVREACMGCLARDPSARPTAAELADRLHRAAAGTGSALGVTTDLSPADVPTQAMALPAGLARQRSFGLGRYRRWAMAALLAVGLAAGMLGLIGIGPGGSAPPQAVAAPVAPAVAQACAVSYRLEFADTQRMTVHIVATNSGDRLPAGWRLTMRMASPPSPGFQLAGDWRTVGPALQSPPQTPLAAGASTQLTLTAITPGSAPLPTRFQLAGRACGATSLGATVTASPTNAEGTAMGAQSAPANPAPDGANAIQRDDNQNQQ